MDGEILRISSALGPAEVFANPSIKHFYDSLFPTKKDRMVLDLSLKPDRTVVMDNAKSSGIKISRMVKVIHLAAQIYFINVKKDEQEAEYLQEVLNNTRYSSRMKNYINDYFIDGLYKMGTREGRYMRVGKILQAVSNMNIDNPEIIYAIKNYHFAKVSSTRNSALIIILSRHPYDIAGMSTGRDWTSCMNLDTGFNRHYVPASIAGGVLIAYLCNGNDTNINHPLGRVLIKPCIREGEQIQANPANFILRCSNAYGTFSNTYIKQLQDWLDKHWNN